MKKENKERYKLPKSSRLSNRKIIKSIFSRKGTDFWSGTGFYVSYIVEKSQDSQFIFAISVPKRRIKSAVKRNLIKRRTRETLRKELPELNRFCAKQGLKISAFFVYRTAKVLTYKKIEQQITEFTNDMSRKIRL